MANQAEYDAALALVKNAKKPSEVSSALALLSTWTTAGAFYNAKQAAIEALNKRAKVNGD